jgi:hypothetical protein
MNWYGAIGLILVLAVCIVWATDRIRQRRWIAHLKNNVERYEKERNEPKKGGDPE